MSTGDGRDDFRERGIQEYWDHTYAQWDRGYNQQRLEREHEITKLGLEGKRLGRDVERAERLAELDRLREEMEAQVQTLRRDKASILKDISSYLEGFLIINWGLEWLWLQDLEKIDVTRAEAGAELAALRDKVRVSLRAVRENIKAIDRQGFPNLDPGIRRALGLPNAGDLKSPLIPTPRRPVNLVTLKLKLRYQAQETSLSRIEVSISSLISGRGVLESQKSLYETLRSHP